MVTSGGVKAALDANSKDDRNLANATGILAVAHGGTGNSSVDSTPTASSTKMVTSGGVKAALDANSKDDRNLANATGILAVAHGGTGAKDFYGASYNIMNVGTQDVELNDTRNLAVTNETQNINNGIFRWSTFTSFWRWIKGHCDLEYEKKDKLQYITNWEDFADGLESGKTVWVGQGSMFLDTTQTDNKVWLGIYNVVCDVSNDKWSVSASYYRRKTSSSEKIYINHIESIFSDSVFPTIKFFGYRLK